MMIFLSGAGIAKTVQAAENMRPVLPDTVSVPVQPDTSTAVRDTIPEGEQPVEAMQDTIPGESGRMQEIGEEAAEEVPQDTVHIWKYALPEGFETGETDSTMRWISLLNLFDRFHSRKGAVTYRMGTTGRMDGIELHAFETRHLNLEMEGLDLNDPLTSAVNWNRLPVHKIAALYEDEYGASYRAQTRLRDHYLVQPRTYLNFDESKFNHRSLEFSFTQNFLKTTNLELSFWDRRDGGGYQNSDVEGRQVVTKVYHQLSDRWLMKGGFINNSLERGEPFGYSISDPRLFGFNRFVEIPLQQSAGSVQASNDLYLQFHHRKDTTRTVSTELGLHYQTDKWNLEYSADSVATDFQKVELFARQQTGSRAGSTSLTGTGRVFLLREREGANLTRSGWIGGSAGLKGQTTLFGLAEMSADASLTAWNDSRMSAEVSARLRIDPLEEISLSLFGGVLSRAPDLQAYYWESDEFTGSDLLVNEASLLGGAGGEISLTRHVTLGVRGDIRETSNAVFIDEEGQFTNIPSYSMMSGTAWLTLDSRIFEGELSGTYKTYSSASLNPLNRMLSTSGDHLWIKSHLYWKNYLFDRATYVKAGLSGIFSPNPFRTAEFVPSLNRWQHGTNEFVNPSYYRLDVDVSARVRWFMVLLKWENVLDRVQQLGYFESTGYPMPERRFRFGIRVLFTN